MSGDITTDECTELSCPHHGEANRQKRADAEQAGRPPCSGFQWIGQSFAHCDGCGAPYWEHAFDEQLNRDKGPFSPDAWVYVPISPEEAEATRRKWEGS